MSAVQRPEAALYLLDQDRETTSSLGIFHYARNLARTMAELPDPGFDVVLWVSTANEAEFRPARMPDWMHVVRVRGRFGSGLRRVVADHVLAPALARTHRPDVLHFPKGWLPLRVPARVACVVTLHDTIVQFYRAKYPGYFPRLKTAYFHWMARHALRRADHVITISNFSARELAALARPRMPPLSIIPSAGLAPGGEPPANERCGLLVIGSRLPHKATAETLRRLDAYAAARGMTEPVTVVGVPDLASIPGASAPAALRVEFAGRIPFEALERRMAASRAVVVLSEIEGFGLPLLEAYSRYTPVCFRNTTAMAEVLEGVPGAWDGDSDASFFDALEACLRMGPRDVARVREELARRFDWTAAVEATLDVYRSLIRRAGEAS